MIFFDYIYYRITKFYFKWDGRTGATAIVTISLIQILLLIDVGVILMRLFYDRDVTQTFIPTGKIVICVAFITFSALNYNRYNGSYNKYRFRWKDESESSKILKGFLVLLSIVLPFVPVMLVAIYW